MTPLTMQEIQDRADELAARFENYNPADRDGRDTAELRAAVLARAGR